MARELGITEHRAELLPEDKVDAVHALKTRYGTIAMVGDGVNDAPALAAADVGIAMGAAGSDAALETADVALMGDDLSKIPFALRLSRATLRNIKTNIAASLLLKFVFLALAADRPRHALDGDRGRHRARRCSSSRTGSGCSGRPERRRNLRKPRLNR